MGHLLVPLCGRVGVGGHLPAAVQLSLQGGEMRLCKQPLWKAGDLKGSPGEGEQCSGMDAHPQVSTLTVPPIPLTGADTLPHDLGSFLSPVLFQEIPVLARAAATGSPGLESLRVQGLSLAIPSSFVLRDAEIRDTVITWGEQLGRSDPLGAAALVGWPPHAPC